MKPSPQAALDVEVFPNWLYVLAADSAGQPLYEFEQWQGEAPRYTGVMPDRLITYNGVAYDLPICAAIRAGRSPVGVAALSRELIQHNGRPANVLRQRGIRPWSPREHVDVFCTRNSTPASLKLKAARLHHPRLELIPSDPSKPLARGDTSAVKSYCREDCRATWTCYYDARPFIELLADFPSPRPLETPPATSGERYWERHATRELETTAPPVVLRTPFSDECPDLARLQDRLDAMGETLGGSVATELLNVPVSIGDGGIHTQERALVADDVLMVDASSYYARLLIALDREHRTVPGFTRIVSELLAMRLNFERDKSSDELDVGGRTVAKLILASGTGKLNSEYSCLYDTSCFLAMTRSSQSLMLDLAARIIAAGATVYSINTDGVVCSDTSKAVSACRAWETATGIPLTYKPAAKYRARDINCYVAADANGEVVKSTGALFPRNRNSNPRGEIIAESAAQAALECDDWQSANALVRKLVAKASHPSDFAIVRQTGTTFELVGASIGRLVRFAVAKDGAPLTAGGRRVADSVALMPDYATFDMSQVDRRYYGDEAMKLWESVHARGPLL